MESNSAFAGDAVKSPVFQTAHAAWYGLSSAIDHLHAVKGLIVDAHLLHPYAPYSLLRTATENAATAIWLMAPSRQTRLQRRLKLAYSELNEVAKARDFAEEAWAHARPITDQRRELIDLATTLGIDHSDVAGRFSYEKVVHAAGEACLFGGDATVFWWRLFSSFAHARYWAALGLLNREVLAGEDADERQLRMTTSVEQVVSNAHVPFLLIQAGVSRFERLRTSPYTGTSLT